MFFKSNRSLRAKRESHKIHIENVTCSWDMFVTLSPFRIFRKYTWDVALRAIVQRETESEWSWSKKKEKKKHFQIHEVFLIGMMWKLCAWLLVLRCFYLDCIIEIRPFFPFLDNGWKMYMYIDRKYPVFLHMWKWMIVENFVIF